MIESLAADIRYRLDVGARVVLESALIVLLIGQSVSCLNEFCYFAGSQSCGSLGECNSREGNDCQTEANVFYEQLIIQEWGAFVEFRMEYFTLCGNFESTSSVIRVFSQRAV